MTFKEEHRDLFSVDFKKYTLAHCISVDCKMGAGIAVPIKKKFKLGGLQKLVEGIGTAVYHNGVYNLITKRRFFHKPTYSTLEASIESMRIHAEDHSITDIAMPKIGCGLDGLSWPRVRDMIKNIFKDTDINVLVCYK